VSTSHSSNLQMKDRRTHLQLHCVKMPLPCEHCNDHAENYEEDAPVASRNRLCANCSFRTMSDTSHTVGAGGALRGTAHDKDNQDDFDRASNGDESFACAHGDVCTCDKGTRTDGEPTS
jgi:hypothetical protein